MELRSDDSASFSQGLRRSTKTASTNSPGDHDHDADWEIDPRDIEVKEAVGSGEFGTVHRALWFSSTVAVKVVRSMDHTSLADFRAELHMLQKLHHPHTVQFLGLHCQGRRLRPVSQSHCWAHRYSG
ncbi:hypothetical protein WJX84_005756 [Apatococcus fuscideae]|uniref:Protein kinase domain-containing protein n=1 Tax=Apatococcus fuscideae TaxID=2026836 RepID=A0AAW1SH02_9CHLO